MLGHIGRGLTLDGYLSIGRRGGWACPGKERLHRLPERDLALCESLNDGLSRVPRSSGPHRVNSDLNSEEA